MSDKKRQNSSTSSELPASAFKKHKFTSGANASSTLPPELLSPHLTFLGVREFKKEALGRAISSYKLTSELFESQAERSEKRLALLQNLFSIQESWINDVLNQFDAAVTNNSNSNKKPIPIPSSHVKDNFLLGSTESNQDSDNENENGEEEDNNNNDDDNNNNTNVDDENDLMRKYKSKTQDLKSKIDKILEWDGNTNEYNNSQTRNSTAIRNLHTFEADYNVLKANSVQLETQLKQMTEKYLESQKDISELLLPAIDSVAENSENDGQGSESKQPEQSNEPTANDSSVSSSKDEKPKEEEEEEKEKAIDTEEIKKLQQKLDQTKEVTEKQCSELKSQDNHIISLHETIRHSNSRLAHLTDADLHNSHVHRTLQRRVDDLLLQLDRLDQIYADYAREKSTLISERANFQERVRRDYDLRLDEMQARLDRAENEVSRIRAARDETLSTLNIKRASGVDNSRSFEQMKDLIKIRERRIRSLEEEIRRLQDSTGKEEEQGKEESDKNLDNLSIEELKNMAIKLKREKSSLEAELPDLEVAFNSAHQKATAKVMDFLNQEAKLNNMIVEKTKADEKYFSAMRSKDALTGEYQKVQSQLSRNAEWIQQLKDTKRKNQHLIEVLEKKVEEMQVKVGTLEQNNGPLNSKLMESDRRGDSLRSLAEKLESDLKEKDRAIRNEVESRREVEQEIVKLKKQIEVQSLEQKSVAAAAQEGNNKSSLTSNQTSYANSAAGSVNGGSHAFKSDLDMQIQELRSIAICSVCSKNWKDTAIKVCGHVFCETCAVDRLTARLRKCPLCNKQYSHNDLLPIHL